MISTETDSEDNKVDTYLEKTISQWLTPLDEKFVLNLLSENRVAENTFALHCSDTNLNEYFLTLKSENHLEQIQIFGHRERCKYTMGNLQEPQFSTLSEIICNILAKRIRIKVDQNRELIFKSYFKNPIPIKKWFIAGKFDIEAKDIFETTSSTNKFAIWLNKDWYFTLAIKTKDVEIIRIVSQKKGYTIDTITFFNDIEQLVNYYLKHPLPTGILNFNKSLQTPYEYSGFYACMVSKRIEELMLKQYENEPGKDGFQREFMDMVYKTKRNSFGYYDALKDSSLAKNRYTNILAYDHTRVKLNGVENDYINANYVEGDFQSYPPAYILCQAPLQSTIDDHWRMIIQENINIIVILTSFVEKGIKKCLKYWPELNKSMEACGNYKITTVKEGILRDISRIMLTIKNNVFSSNSIKSTGSINKLIILHYLGWPDNGVPADVWGIIELLGITNKERHKYPPSSVLIHCSAGIGRSGAYIIIDILLNKIKNEGAQAVLDIKEAIIKGRTQRALLVATSDQYIFIYLVIKKYLDWKLGHNSFKLCFRG
ncbi:hypothetical protein HZS_541 [Henneguya salminicola]|nr:hypothetical protein HZS_541 [Henneguya salminicola]